MSGLCATQMGWKQEHQFPLRNMPCKTPMWCCAPGHKHLSVVRGCLAGTLGQGLNCLRAGVRGPGVFGTLWGVFPVSQSWRNSLRQPYQSSRTDRIGFNQPGKEDILAPTPVLSLLMPQQPSMPLQAGSDLGQCTVPEQFNPGKQ